MTRFSIPSQQLPDVSKPRMDFEESSFFVNHGLCNLPDPETVKRAAPDNQSTTKPKPVVFEELGLIVKYGISVSPIEAQNLWLLRHVFRTDEVPVPEVYAWRTYGREVFIYMELMPGTTLKSQWDTLTIAEKTSVSD